MKKPRLPVSTGRVRLSKGRLRLLALLGVVVVVVVVLVMGGGSDKGKSGTGEKSSGPGSSKPGDTSLSGGSGVPKTLRQLAARLPLDRQVAQLFLVGFSGFDANSNFLVRLRTRDWGGVVLARQNYLNPQQLTGLAAAVTATAQSVGHVPPLIAAAQIGGPDTAFPDLPPESQAKLGARGKPDAARRAAQVAGVTLRTLGVNTVLAPDADVAVTGGFSEESSFSTDPRVVAQFTKSALAGWAKARVAAVVGHFPGQGAASRDPDIGPATVGGSLDDLSKRDLVPFAAVAKQAPAIMVSNAQYAAFDGVTPAVLWSDAIGGVLRQRLGYNGVVVCGDLGATAQIAAEGIGRVAIDALKAGCDLLYLQGGVRDQQQAYDAVLSAAKAGRLSRVGIGASLYRVLQLKGRYGLIAPASKP